MNVYRFRSMEYLLGDKYQELEKQAIYFASPDQLNDPMEGFRDIVWRGDRIVWTNLLKHYIYCLVVCYFLYTITRDSEEFDLNKIPIPARWDQPPNLTIDKLFDDIWHQFLNLPKIPEIIEALGNTNREIRYGEIELLLSAIQWIFIVENKDLYFQHGISPESKMQQLTEGLMSAQELSKLILTSLSDMEESDTGEIDNHTDQTIASIMAAHRLNHLLNHFNSPVQPAKGAFLKNALLMMLDFPKKYLNEIDKLLWPNWYTACFMKNFHNSSVWSHYGDQHRGACLIFEAEKTGGSERLTLHQATDNSMKQMPFHEITYRQKPSEVDFFRYIVRLPLADLMKLWYSDEAGNPSECAPQISDVSDADAWIETCREIFHRDITIKTNDWEYEQECRLILEDWLNECDEDKNRTLTYDFNSLKGIIFGIKTSDEDRLKIIEIIIRKCVEHNRESFTFFQAYYSSKDLGIRKDEMEIQLQPHVGTVASDRPEN